MTLIKVATSNDPKTIACVYKTLVLRRATQLVVMEIIIIIIKQVATKRSSWKTKFRKLLLNNSKKKSSINVGMQVDSKCHLTRAKYM